MILVESIRLRRWSLGWTAVIVLIAIVIAFAIQHAISTVQVNGSRWDALNVPLITFAPLAMFLSMIYASGAALSLNQEGQTLALSWTKPLSRAAIALRIVAVDVVAIVASNVVAWIVIMSLIAIAHGSFVVTPSEIPTLVLSLGVALMWYALIVAITGGLPSSGGAVMGLLWPGALIVSQLRGQFGATIDTIILALNAINPLAYMNFAISSESTQTAGMGFWQAPVDERALIVWLLTAVLIALGIALWTRREA